MLVLSRKLLQQIKIGQDITITILRISRGQVQVGVEADKRVKILRGELPEQKPDKEAA